MKNIKVKDSIGGISGSFEIYKIKNGIKTLVQKEHNLVVASAGGYGKNIVARQLAGDTTYPIEIDSAGIGTGSTAPAITDTALETQTLGGIAIATKVAVNTTITMQIFIADGALANGTYREFGLFCDGRLFARSLFAVAYTKASGEDTLILYTITIN